MILTPQQNGIAERLNCTLIECVCTMLADSKLPHRFWAEALSMSVYLQNHSPTKALQGITPYEACSSIQPDIYMFPLHIWLQCLCHVHKAERCKTLTQGSVCCWTMVQTRKGIASIILDE